MKVLVLGGTRFIGRDVVAALQADRHDVTVVHRGISGSAPPGVDQIRGDRRDPAVLAAMSRVNPRTVVDMSAYSPEDSESLLEALPSVTRWLHCSTAAVYKPIPSLPLEEDGPMGPWEIWGPYGHGKLACERLLHERRPAGSVTVSFRPPYVLGPGNYANREEFVFNRILDGQPIFVDGSGDAPLHMVSSRDIGAMFALAVTAPLPPGFTAVNAATETVCTTNGFIDLCSQIVGKRARVVHVLDSPTHGVFDRDDHIFPFPDVPYVLSTRRADKLGLLAELDDLHSVLRSALQHLLDHPERRAWAPGPSECELRSRRA